MKKLLSVFIAFCIALCTGVSAFAQETADYEALCDKVDKQIAGAVDYLTGGVQGYGVENALDYFEICNSSVSTEAYDKYYSAFLNSVEENLKANGGKLVVNGKESIGIYGAVLMILDMSEELTDFRGYNLVDAFLKTDLTVPPENAYDYLPAIYACVNTTAYEQLEDFGKALCKSYADNFYVMGKGVDYYGFGCDNTANFICALSGYYEDYEAELRDALAVMETYKVDGGYCFNPEYGTEPNCNSTAAALKAYGYLSLMTATDENWVTYEKLNAVYNDLCAFESEKTGVFTFDGEENPIATKDALSALNVYYWDAFMQMIMNIPDEEPTTEEDTTKESTTEKKVTKPAVSKTTVKASAAKTTVNKSKKSPNTGTGLGAAALIAFLGAGAVTLAVKKKEN